MKGSLRPNTFANCPNRGCGTDEATTNELAIQTYFSAPPISAVTVGNAVMIIATSRAEIKDKIHNATKMPQKRIDFLFSGILAE
jgi:hypothetical protein